MESYAFNMKFFSLLFDFLLYEGLFLSLFSFFLLMVDDPKFDLFFKISLGSLILAAIFWVIGKAFNFFQKEDMYKEY